MLAHAFDQDVELPEDEAGCVPLLRMLDDELTSVDARIEQLARTKEHLTRLVGDVTRIMAGKRCAGAEPVEKAG